MRAQWTRIAACEMRPRAPMPPAVPGRLPGRSTALGDLLPQTSEGCPLGHAPATFPMPVTACSCPMTSLQEETSSSHGACALSPSMAPLFFQQHTASPASRPPSRPGPELPDHQRNPRERLGPCRSHRSPCLGRQRTAPPRKHPTGNLRNGPEHVLSSVTTCN